MIEGIERPSAPPDLEALADAARGGDAAATDLLLELARPKLARTALALGVPPDEVPDLVQEVLLSGWRNLARFSSSKGSFIGWMMPGLVGRVRNRTRAGGRRHRLLERMRLLLGRIAHSGDEDHDAVEARLTLKRLLRALTARQREVVALYELDGLSAAETASALEMSEAGVRSIARDARNRLKNEARRLGLSAQREGEA